jgi:hypothetical protein
VMSNTMGSVKRMRMGLLTFLIINSLKSTSISSCLAWMPQFFVRRRNSEALLINTTGGYVSSRKNNRSPKVRKPMNELMYMVHRQPWYDCVMKPPIKGAINGPMNTVAEKTATARPRTSLLNMSANTAATMARGEEPQRPAKKRQIMTVWMSLATATAIVKMEKPKAAITSGGRRPYSSEIGAHMTGYSVSKSSMWQREVEDLRGPKAYPNTKRLVPSVPTSLPTPNWAATGPVALEKMEEPIEALNASKASMTPMVSFFFVGQFCACSGSSWPSNSTTYSSRSGSSGGKGLPAPMLGNGFSVLRRVIVRERRDGTWEAPTVPAC